MKYARSIVGILVAALVCAVVTEPVCLAGVPGDVNGDARTDVRDIQVLATALCEPGAVPVNGDANKDGRVDVLDFQYVVAQAEDQPAEPPRSSAPERQTACMPASGVVLTVKLDESGGIVVTSGGRGRIPRPEVMGPVSGGCQRMTTPTRAQAPPHAPPLRI